MASSHGRTIAAFITHDPRDPADSPMLVADVHADGLGAADTALRTTSQGTGFGCAVFAGRRWIVRSQQTTPRVQRFIVRTAYSDTTGRWHELPARGVDETMCAVAALDERRALVVHAGESGLRWAVAHGAAWGDSGVLDPRPGHARNPRLSRDTSSSLWLLWTEKTATKVARFAAGRWSAPESVACHHPEEGEYWSSWTAMSADGERPALGWGDRGVGTNHRDVLCLSAPGATGWPRAEEVPASDGAAVPALARDANGDLWVAWESRDGGQLFFAHSYVAATCIAPTLRSGRQGIVVAWTLDAPAPGSRWTVLRSVDESGFVAVATRRAGDGTTLDWTDPAPPPGRRVAYRIRRECLDASHAWSSPPAVLELAE
jgi:hypothetical protein